MGVGGQIGETARRAVRQAAARHDWPTVAAHATTLERERPGDDEATFWAEVASLAPDRRCSLTIDRLAALPPDLLIVGARREMEILPVGADRPIAATVRREHPTEPIGWRAAIGALAPGLGRETLTGELRTAVDRRRFVRTDRMARWLWRSDATHRDGELAKIVGRETGLHDEGDEVDIAERLRRISLPEPVIADAVVLASRLRALRAAVDAVAPWPAVHDPDVRRLAEACLRTESDVPLARAVLGEDLAVVGGEAPFTDLDRLFRTVSRSDSDRSRLAEIVVARFPRSALGHREAIHADPTDLGHRCRALEAVERGLVTWPELPIDITSDLDPDEPAQRDLRDRARVLFDTVVSGRDDEAVWRAVDRAALGDPDGAVSDLLGFLDRHAGHPLALRRMGRLLLGRSDIRTDADAWAALSGHRGAVAPWMRREIDRTARLVALFGADLADPASVRGQLRADGPIGLAAVAAVHHAPPPSATAAGLVLLSGSLAPGGAEKILALATAEATRRWRERGEAGPRPQLWLFHTTDGPDAPLHHLPLTGMTPEDLIELTPTEPTDELASVLPGGLADRCQAIIDHLRPSVPSTVHAWMDYASIPAAIAALRVGVPRIVLHCHNMRPPSLSEFYRDWDEPYRELLQHPAVRLVACSQASLDDYLDWIGCPETQTAVVHNGFDLTAIHAPDAHRREATRSSLHIPSGSLVVGAAFRFAPVKRVDLWLDTAARIADREPAATFVLAGDGPLRASARQLAEDLGIGDRCRFPGWVDDVDSIVGSMDVLMITSDSESLPNASVEAQYLGVPVVAFDVGGVVETMIPGVTGQVVRHGDVAGLAAAVIAVLRNPAWRATAADRAPAWVADRFSVSAMMDRLEQLYA